MSLAELLIILLWFGLVIYVFRLAIRLVAAVERIADNIGPSGG